MLLTRTATRFFTVRTAATLRPAVPQEEAAPLHLQAADADVAAETADALHAAIQARCSTRCMAGAPTPPVPHAAAKRFVRAAADKSRTQATH